MTRRSRAPSRVVRRARARQAEQFGGARESCAANFSFCNCNRLGTNIYPALMTTSSNASSCASPAVALAATTPSLVFPSTPPTFHVLTLRAADSRWWLASLLSPRWWPALWLRRRGCCRSPRAVLPACAVPPATTVRRPSLSHAHAPDARHRPRRAHTGAACGLPRAPRSCRLPRARR